MERYLFFEGENATMTEMLNNLIGAVSGFLYDPWVPLFLVVAGVVLQGLGFFEPLKDFAGSGVTVPLLGFGAALAEGTAKIISEDGAIGIFTGPLTSGAGGIMIAILSGLVMSLLTKPKAK